MISPTITAAIATACIALGAYAEHVRMGAVLARAELAHAAEIEQYTASLLAGAQATDKAVTVWYNRVTQAEANAHALKTKLSTLQRRACLSADAVRLLNGANSVPTSAERVADSATPTPANPAGYASSHAVSIWAADVQRQYDACRAQVDALRAWDEGTYGP